jgi:hypothetical protein
MSRIPWGERIAIMIGRARSDAFSILSGAFVGAATNVLTSLVWSRALWRDLPWALVSSFFIFLAGLTSTILSWKMKDLQEIVDAKTQSRLLQFPTEEERWQFAVCQDQDRRQYRNLISLPFLLVSVIVFAVLGIVIIIIWVNMTQQCGSQS